MLLYTLTRLAYLAMVLVVMSILVFLVTQAMPGDVASMIAGQFASKEVIDAITVKLGLDQPLIVQYGRWAAGILQGDLGRSLVLEQPVAPILMEALSRSLVLAVVALAVVTVIGIGVALLIGGAVVTESVFAIPGLGRLTIDAIVRRDYPLIQGLVLMFSFVYVLVNLAIDLIYTLLDPRIRY